MDIVCNNSWLLALFLVYTNGKILMFIQPVKGGGRVVRRCWVNFLLIWIIVGKGRIALAVGAGGGCLDIFSLSYYFSFLSPSL